MSPSELRARGRESLRGSWPTAVLVTLAASLVGASRMNGPKIQLNFDVDTTLPAISSMDPRAASLFANLAGLTASAMMVAALAMFIVSLIFGSAFHLGYCRYHLNLYDKKEARFSDLFSRLDAVGPAICMGLLRSLIIGLGTLCLVIPGFIAQYGLCMAGFIMAEDPDCGAVDALKRSWDMTSGHKMDLFILQLTFLGWYLLASFTGGVGMLFVTPYQDATLAAVYRRMKPASRYTTYL